MWTHSLGSAATGRQRLRSLNHEQSFEKLSLCPAGVIPIDRLTDVRAPIEVVLLQAGVKQIERVYNISVPRSAKR